MDDFSIKDIKSYIERKYSVLPKREGVSVDGDDFLTYTRRVRSFLKRAVIYELYIEKYKGSTEKIGAVYTERVGRKVRDSWVSIFSTIEDLDRRIEEDSKIFLHENEISVDVGTWYKVKGKESGSFVEISKIRVLPSDHTPYVIIARWGEADESEMTIIRGTGTLKECIDCIHDNFILLEKIK